MIYRARVVVPMEGRPIGDGAVAIEDGMITAVGRAADLRRSPGGTVTDLGEQVLLPGLINAHCHLDYTILRNAILPPPGFTHWIQRLNGLKRQFFEDDYVRAVLAGFDELKRWGTTTVVNVESFPGILRRLPPPPVRVWWFFELIDLVRPVRSLDFGEKPARWLGGIGLSPHAPYTASVDLYRRALATGRLITTHLAESAEEAAMFEHAAGPLHRFVAALGRDMSDCGHGTVIQHLAAGGVLHPSMILVHVNEVAGSDFLLLRGMHIVHCPRSHRYFGHTHFPLHRLAEGGANICLGTDSLASNQSLSLFAEMRLLLRTYPGLEPRHALETVTLNPARALGLAGRIGCLRPGAFADAIALPFDGPSEEVLEAVIHHTTPINWMLCNGVVQH